MNDGEPVQLYLYDLSRGMAKTLSPQLVGKTIGNFVTASVARDEWHTSVVIYGVEYYFGQGIQQSLPGRTIHGQPLKILLLGYTHIPREVVKEYLDSVRTIFSPEKYHLLDFNCNTFSSQFTQFLCGKAIPEYITDLPADFLSTPFGQALRPFIENLFGPSKLQHQPASSIGQKKKMMSGVVEIFQAEEIDQALKQQRATVLYFTQESCGPCRFIKPKYEDYIQHCCAQGRDIYGGIVDIANPQLYPYFKRYGLRGTPSFLYFLRGELVHQVVGANYQEMCAGIDSLIEMSSSTVANKDDELPLEPILFPIIAGKGLFAQIIKKQQSLITLSEAESALLVKIAEVLEQWAVTTVDLPKEWVEIAHGLIISRPVSDLDKLYPLVDILRLALLHPALRADLLQSPIGETMLMNLIQSADRDSCPKPFMLMVIRLTCNLFKDEQGTLLVMDPTIDKDQRHPLEVTTALLIRSLLAEDVSVRRNGSSLAYNMGLTVAKNYDSYEPDWLLECVGAIVTRFALEKEEEIMFRLTAALIRFLGPAPNEELRDLCVLLGAREATVNQSGGSERLKDLLQRLTLLLS